MKKKSSFSIFKLILIIVLAVLLFNLISGLLSPKAPANVANNTTVVENNGTEEKNSYEGFSNNINSHYSSNWQLQSNVGKLDMSVPSGVRNKRTEIIGNNKDKVTIMVYMCGSDLESQYAMGVYDLQEMASAKLNDNVNIIVYTGGTTKWHTSIISNRYNQIYKIVGDGNIQPLVENAGTGAMIDPNTLLSFIEYCKDNYEANRYELIMWDHGGGTVSGYGYDEKFPKQGSMSLAQLDRALTEADVKFDFIGFDACLMANTETALMLSEHADYMIASEESEPGIGWYYTNWLSKLCENTSMHTVEIGKNIADDFVKMCGNKTPGQTATLSVVDLAEIEDLIPERLSEFASSTSELIDYDFQTVAQARKGTREFAADSYLDLVDVVDLAARINTDESKKLAQSLMSAVKYNNTSSDISNAYGLSIYFPYRSGKYVNTVLNTYDDINMNPEYADCVRNFATYSTSGQLSSGGSHYAYQSYDNYDYSNYYSNQSSEELIMDVLEMFMNGSYSSNDSYSNFYGSGLEALFGGRDNTKIAKYIANNHFDADLSWKDNKIALTAKQWSMIDSIKLNMFIDDGEGYIELGKDNVFELDDNGNLLKPSEMTWVVASNDNSNWQVAPYYYISQTTDGDNTVTLGRIPVMLNGTYANLIIRTDDESMEVVGATYDYKGGTDIVAKNIDKLNADDEITFICDYYKYDGTYDDTYTLGDPIKISDKLYLGDMDISSQDYLACYEFRDIYQQSFYSTAVK